MAFNYNSSDFVNQAIADQGSSYLIIQGIPHVSGTSDYNIATNALRNVNYLSDEKDAQAIDLNNDSSEIELKKNTRITGDLVVVGQQTSIGCTALYIADNTIKIASNNNADLIDGSVYMQYNDGATGYGGWMRDHNDGSFKFFNTTTEPADTVADYSLGNLHIGGLTGTTGMFVDMNTSGLCSGNTALFNYLESGPMAISGSATISENIGVSGSISSTGPFTCYNQVNGQTGSFSNVRSSGIIEGPTGSYEFVKINQNLGVTGQLRVGGFSYFDYQYNYGNVDIKEEKKLYCNSIAEKSSNSNITMDNPVGFSAGVTGKTNFYGDIIAQGKGVSGSTGSFSYLKSDTIGTNTLGVTRTANIWSKIQMVMGSTGSDYGTMIYSDSQLLYRSFH